MRATARAPAARRSRTAASSSMRPPERSKAWSWARLSDPGTSRIIRRAGVRRRSSQEEGGEDRHDGEEDDPRDPVPRARIVHDEARLELLEHRFRVRSGARGGELALERREEI